MHRVLDHPRRRRVVGVLSRRDSIQFSDRMVRDDEVSTSCRLEATEVDIDSSWFGTFLLDGLTLGMVAGNPAD